MSTDELQTLEEQANETLAGIADEESLEEWRVNYLGRRSRLTEILRGLSALPIEERKQMGAAANRLREALESILSERRDALRQQSVQTFIQQGRIDVTLPGRPVPMGRLHPVTQTQRDIVACFEKMGFQAVEGPEVEWDYYNFEALRIPEHHPARDMWDTMWIDYQQDGRMPMLLRTHTSPNQVRVMERQQPPIRVVVPGKCYRYEATDATHEWMLTQVEGLAVDEGISMADLKGTLYEFAKQLFGQERRVRFRCDYFPFVEPGADMSIDCFVCNGEGCSTCKGAGWIEIMGAGMVHPEILANVGYDPERYTGFAFGMGVERVAMLRHGIEDIRLFYQNDLRFLEQF
jgi:phenylalanyl-tRNA synthetase alpha chain